MRFMIIECTKSKRKQRCIGLEKTLMSRLFIRALPGTDHQFVDVAAALDAIAPGRFTKMPFSLRVFAENIVRRQSAADVTPYLAALAARNHALDFPYYPARVVLQD